MSKLSPPFYNIKRALERTLKFVVKHSLLVKRYFNIFCRILLLGNKEVRSMKIRRPSTCTTCGSNNINYIQPPNATAFVLTTIDTTKTPPAFNPTTGFAVHVFKCEECGSVSLQSNLPE
jgi:hypothetical protein